MFKITLENAFRDNKAGENSGLILGYFTVTIGKRSKSNFGYRDCQLVHLAVEVDKHCINILTFCWPCISVYLSQYLTNLMHKYLFHNKFYFMPLHVSSTCDHHQEVRIALHSLWYHHTFLGRWIRRKFSETWPLWSPLDTYKCDDTRGCVMQFLPPDDQHTCSKHVEAWNKFYCETNFVHQVG